MKMYRARSICVALLPVLICGSVSGPAVANTDSDTYSFQMRVSPVLPFGSDRAEVVLRFTYVGLEESAILHLPKGQEVRAFRHLALLVDGLKPEYVFDFEDGGKPKNSWMPKLHRFESVDLRIRLEDIWKFPARWKAIQLAPTSIHGVKPTVSAGLILKRAQGEKVDPVQLVVVPVQRFDPHNPEVRLVYCYSGKKDSLNLYLPEGKGEVASFEWMTVTVDGRKAELVAPDKLNPKPTRSHVAVLEPGETTALRIKLNDIWKLPKEWKKLELNPRTLPEWQAPEITGSVVLERREGK